MSFSAILLNCNAGLTAGLLPARPPVQPVLAWERSLQKPLLQTRRAEARFALDDLPFAEQAWQIFADVP